MIPSTIIAWADPARRAAFEHWLEGIASSQSIDPGSLRPASADASFRRYFRIDGARAGEASRIVMDAPPSHEDCRPFVQVAGLLRNAGVRAPEVIEWDEAQGFMLLDDLGSTTLLDALGGMQAALAAPFYRAASDTLIALQRIDAQSALPAYDETLLRRELGLFEQWYVAQHCTVTLDAEESERWARCQQLIVDACLAQPRVLVHRDFHSRNLMVGDTPGGAPGVLDFQDAVWGPVTYDLASLLRDAYIEWDEEVQLDWAIRYWERARKAGVPVGGDFGDFWRDFEWMGLQRHLKVLGIFSRLHHRDGKDGYLKDIPLVWRYAHRVAARYQGLGPLAHLLEKLAGTQRESGYTF